MTRLRAGIRVAGVDPGIRNFGYCLLEIAYVDSVIGLEGPRTRSVFPLVRVHDWRVFDLATECDTTAAASATPRLGALRVHLTSEKPAAADMPLWRDNLARAVAADMPGLFTPLHCDMSGHAELPVVALENQLDVTEQRGGAFNSGRMYTLSQVFAASVVALDMQSGTTSRLVINMAKKHGIASDGSSDYAQRKARAVEIVFAMLREQATTLANDNDADVAALAENARQQVRFLERVQRGGAKLDDLADAFLLAVAVGMKCHKRFCRSLLPNNAALPLCYRPVTNAEIDSAENRTALAKLGTRIDAPAPKPKRKRRRAEEEEEEEDDDAIVIIAANGTETVHSTKKQTKKKKRTSKSML